MRMPCGEFGRFDPVELNTISFTTVGCLSFEQRCTAVPLRISARHSERSSLYLLELEDSSDGVPDYGAERREKVLRCRRELECAGVKWTSLKGNVVAGEDELLNNIRLMTAAHPHTVVLDITALPKRYFCFMLRRLIVSESLENLIVTYTEPGAEGYTDQHLAEDVMSPETLPGFGGKLAGDGGNLVIAIGFEALGLRSLIMSHYREVNRSLHIILSFPAAIETVRRQWNTLREIMEDDPTNLRSSNLAVIATWDAEHVFRTLVTWAGERSLVSLAPFGPKPHTLAMALFAVKYDASLWYTQPKVYHPEYSRGVGTTRWYVAKWRGIPCFDRR
jgi:hypothetical protein